ncbi:hypothetical protein EJ03DRAFT_154842 [Teratosphaeria nubilosa]|uniref:Uncharacterized protein n=1 Tax=Teratosphaeria nubilosa TaxID=161662 RepID=A0A6G1LJR0_9PEZI|nr:hypothetical protein EJ03DRAFT_154842 [Teratosphaeria nubilosa]
MPRYTGYINAVALFPGRCSLFRTTPPATTPLTTNSRPSNMHFSELVALALLCVSGATACDRYRTCKCWDTWDIPTWDNELTEKTCPFAGGYVEAGSGCVSTLVNGFDSCNFAKNCNNQAGLGFDGKSFTHKCEEPL